LDIACNNAGIGGNLAPTAMLRQGSGAIVNMASVLGQVGFANAPASLQQGTAWSG
jgi:hypothetical protein